MSKTKSWGRILWLFAWLAIVCTLLVFNISQQIGNRDLSQKIQDAEQELELQSHYFEAQQKFSNIELLKIEIGVAFGEKDVDCESTAQLLRNDWSTLVIDDKEPTRHGVKIFTTCKKPIEVLLNVSRVEHLNAKPLETHKFVFDVVPNVWNRVGFYLDTDNVGDIPVTSIIDGEPEIGGVLPELRASGNSPIENLVYVGNPEPTSDGTWLEKKPYQYLNYTSRVKKKGRVMIDVSFRFADTGEIDQPIAGE